MLTKVSVLFKIQNAIPNVSVSETAAKSCGANLIFSKTSDRKLSFSEISSPNTNSDTKNSDLEILPFLSINSIFKSRDIF